MSLDSASIDLTHHFLIAMPGLEDALFGKSVVYLCEHSARGALGLVINKPGEMRMPELFSKVELPLHRADLLEQPVLRGGPVHPERGFVLHEPIPTVPAESASDNQDLFPDAPAGEPDSVYASTLKIPGGLEMTTSRDVLEALSTGAGPKRVLITLGYSAWGQGQLESELAENSWLTVGADPRIIFETPLEQRYDQALALLGLQPWMLSPGAGHA
jgi:putative transcriptional regulator